MKNCLNTTVERAPKGNQVIGKMSICEIEDPAVPDLKLHNYQVSQLPNVELQWGASVTSFMNEGLTITGLTFKNEKSPREQTIMADFMVDCSGIFHRFIFLKNTS